MLFTMPVFFLFFLIVYLAYLRLGSHKQNLLLLVASYVFYGWWDWRFLFLLLISTVVDFECARAIERTSRPGRRRLFLAVSLCTNLGILGFFKYCDFFILSFQALLSSIGIDASIQQLGIVVPVGISFYTFQTLAYTIDVYRGQFKACRHPLDFALYVSFFPQLVAGPIERPQSLLRQIERPRRLTYGHIREGLYLVVQGYFLKVFIADNAAVLVNRMFAVQDPSGAVVALGAYAFALQIYGDFAGYSRIARGIARVMGFSLMVNFRRPYFATGPADFWHRWHISLSTWLRDYLYIPLGGNRKGPGRTYVNLILTMLLGGLWHGAAWHFVLWGAFHGLLLAATRGLRRFAGLQKSWLVRTASVIGFFQVTCLGWLIFRAEDWSHLCRMVGNLATWRAGGLDGFPYAVPAIVFLGGTMLVYDAVCAGGDRWSARWGTSARPLVWSVKTALALLMLALIFLAGERSGEEFIYFQF